MKEWFSQLDQREQMSLLVLGVVLVLYLLYMLVWSPLADKRDQMALQNSAIAESQVRVDAMVSELLQLRAGGVQTGSRRNLTSVINESTSRLQLPVIRLQPNSRGEIQVRLENASFDDVLKWLYQMEYTEHMLVREVSLTQSSASGLVNVTVRIAEAG
ncbi:MAG: type II secretion system protein M [Halioglobus sp.]|jgi:type II secretory pathway component PulM|nr:type II secretion system protein M [Halioglobus sp.]